MTADSTDEAQAELRNHLEATRFILKSTRNLDESDAARLTDAELMVAAREYGDRDQFNRLIEATGMDTQGLLSESDRSGVLPRNRLQEIPCRSWDEFRAVVARTAASGQQQLWRGQGDSDWELLSEIERLDIHKGTGSDRTLLNAAAIYGVVSRIYLEPFKRAATPVVGRPAAEFEEGEWWALGRHHGLQTPLLDWSESPYVAAFFAFAQFANEVKPGFYEGKPSARHDEIPATDRRIALWSLTNDDSLFVDGELELLETPPFENTRQRAQQAVLTLLRFPTEHGLREYLDGRNRENALVKYTVPAYEFDAAMAGLRSMNIRLSTLFPDLQGAASDANLGRFVMNLSSPDVEAQKALEPGQLEVDHPISVEPGQKFQVAVQVTTAKAPASGRSVMFAASGATGWEASMAYVTDDDGAVALDLVAADTAGMINLYVSVGGIQATHNSSIAIQSDEPSED